MNGCKVGLGAVVLEKPGGIGVFGNDAQTGSIFIQTVHRSESKSGIKGGKIISESVALMPYRGMNGHSAGFVKNHYSIIFKGYRNTEGSGCFKGSVIAGTQNYNVSVFNEVNTADSSAVPCNTVFQSF